jgi:hypothetical protein
VQLVFDYQPIGPFRRQPLSVGVEQNGLAFDDDCAPAAFTLEMMQNMSTGEQSQYQTQRRLPSWLTVKISHFRCAVD